MQQLEIQYFWPLTEQITLDLDYTPCVKYQEEKMSQVACDSVMIANGQYTFASNGRYTIEGIAPSAMTIDIDQLPIIVKSKREPNIFARWVYKIMGVKWERKC